MSLLPSPSPVRLSIRWLICALATCSAPLAVAEVLAISNAAPPLTNSAGARVVLLDASERLEQQLSEGLPADPRQAAAIMQQRMQSWSGQLGRDLSKAHQNVADAWSLGIAKLHAVVVDRQYVLYGQPDVAADAATIEHYRSSKR